MPVQNQAKPGLEPEMVPRTEFIAPHYKGSEKLLVKIALITGGDSGIGRAVAVLYAREGADIAIVYLSQEQSDAEETAKYVKDGSKNRANPYLLRGIHANCFQRGQRASSRIKPEPSDPEFTFLTQALCPCGI